MRSIFSLLVLVGGLLIQGSAAGATLRGPFSYLSPRPGSTFASKESNVVFRPTSELVAHSSWSKDIVVTGSKSGIHSGRWITARDSRTVIFDPDHDFEPGERVRVSLKSDDGEATEGIFSFAFDISAGTRDWTRMPKLCECVRPHSVPKRPGETSQPPQRRRVPTIAARAPLFDVPTDFPIVNVIADDNPGRGHIFVSNFEFGGTAPAGRYMMILDDSGTPVYFRKSPPPFILDFKKQPDGRLSYFVFSRNTYYLMDDTYSVVDSVRALNGYSTDIHGLQILPNGNALIMGADFQPVDMSQIVPGGDPNAVVIGLVIQEIDPDKNVVFEWLSWDHFDILDATHLDFTEAEIDYVHVNSVELDHDGHIIVSNRHMDEVTKISRDTGDIIWRMGGKNNDFSLINDTRWFSHQHSARRQKTGTITLFDNGNFSPLESRAVEYVVDETNMTVTRVWEFKHDPPVFGSAMGNVQRLPNGNTLIGWGSTNPNITEVRPDGSTAFEMSFVPGTFSYRAFRFEWDGVAAAPYLWSSVEDQTLMLHFAKFGDNNVKGYNVYRGDDPEPSVVVAKTTNPRFVIRGFEAGAPLYFRVTALGPGDRESPFSNEVVVTPDFSDDVVPAIVRIQPRTINRESAGQWITARVEIGDGAGSLRDVELSSVMMSNTVAAGAGNLVGNGGKAAVYKFARQAVVDMLPIGDAVAVKVSGSMGELYFEGVDHVRVIDHDNSFVTQNSPVITEKVVLHQNRPNPFNPSTTIRYDIGAGVGSMVVRIYDAAGRAVRTLFDGTPDPGEGRLTWDGNDDAGRAVASGIYFYRLKGADVSLTRKMVLIR